MPAESVRKGDRIQVSLPSGEANDMRGAAKDHWEDNVSLMLRMLFRQWQKKQKKTKD